MKKILILLISLIAVFGHAQTGTTLSAPLTTEPDSILIFTPAKKAAHIPYTDFETKLRASFNLGAAAFSNSYNDLDDLPTIPSFPSFLEFNETDKTLWNNGKSNISTNTSFGSLALNNITTGSSNSAFGDLALRYVTTGQYNTAFGRSAGLGITTGLHNTLIGQGAGTYNGTGNTLIGSGSLFFATSGDNNIALGYGSGSRYGGGVGSNLLTVNNSIFIGNDTRAFANNSINEIVIGDLAIGNGSNTVTIGNSAIEHTYLKGVIHGDGSGLTGISGSVPAGGTTGQVLAKASNDDNDVEWVDQSGGGSQDLEDVLINGSVATSPTDIDIIRENVRFKMSDNIYSGFGLSGNGIDLSAFGTALDTSKVSGLKVVNNDTLQGTFMTNNNEEATNGYYSILSTGGDNQISMFSSTFANGFNNAVTASTTSSQSQLSLSAQQDSGKSIGIKLTVTETDSEIEIGGTSADEININATSVKINGVEYTSGGGASETDEISMSTPVNGDTNLDTHLVNQNARINDLESDKQDILSEGAFVDGDKTKLNGIATNATANSSDATLLNRANHTGTQTASTISDFDTEVSNNTAVAANTAKVGVTNEPKSDPTGVTGADAITNIISLTQAEYDAIGSPNATTLYIIKN